MSFDAFDANLQLSDSGGREVYIGTFGEQLATDIKNDVLAQFTYGISNYDLKNIVETNGGTVTIENDNLLSVNSGTNSAGEAAVESFNQIRYRPGHGVLAQFTAIWTQPTLDNVEQWIGMFNGSNGFRLGFKNGVLTLQILKSGVVVHEVSTGGFNGDGAVGAIDFSKLNIFRITFGYLGIAPVRFEVMLPGTDRFVIIHSFHLQGTQTGTHIDSPYLPIKMEIINNGNTTNAQIMSGSWQGGVFGLCQTCGNRPFSNEHSKTLSGTTEQAIVHYQSVGTFNSKINHIRSKFLRYQFFVDTPGSGTGTVIFRLRKVGSVGGTPSWTSVNATESTLEYDTAGTYVSTGNILGLTEYIGYYSQGSSRGSGLSVVDADSLGLFLDPNGIYAITAQDTGGNSVTVRVAFNWVELF